MSQENVEVVLSLQRFSDDLVPRIRDDGVWAQLAEAATPFVHADCEIVRVGLPGGKTYTGVDEFRESWLDWLAPWSEYRSEVEDAIDCGERVVLLQQSSGRLRGSEQEVRVAPGSVYTFRDGKIARYEVYPEHSSALEAVGLRSRRNL
jgi:ketosteroid isomerase-like protein